MKGTFVPAPARPIRYLGRCPHARSVHWHSSPIHWAALALAPPPRPSQKQDFHSSLHAPRKHYISPFPVRQLAFPLRITRTRKATAITEATLGLDQSNFRTSPSRVYFSTVVANWATSRLTTAHIVHGHSQPPVAGPRVDLRLQQRADSDITADRRCQSFPTSLGFAVGASTPIAVRVHNSLVVRVNPSSVAGIDPSIRPGLSTSNFTNNEQAKQLADLSQ